MDSPSLELLKGRVYVVITDVVSGGHLGSAGFMVGSNDPKGVFQSKQFHDFDGQDLGRRLKSQGTDNL